MNVYEIIVKSVFREKFAVVCHTMSDAEFLFNNKHPTLKILEIKLIYENVLIKKPV